MIQRHIFVSALALSLECRDFIWELWNINDFDRWLLFRQSNWFLLVLSWLGRIGLLLLAELTVNCFDKRWRRLISLRKIAYELVDATNLLQDVLVVCFYVKHYRQLSVELLSWVQVQRVTVFEVLQLLSLVFIDFFYPFLNLVDSFVDCSFVWFFQLNYLFQSLLIWAFNL